MTNTTRQDWLPGGRVTARTAPRGAMLRALRALADAGDRAAQTKWRRAVEGALRAHPTLTAAAEALGMSRRGLTLWVDADASLGALVERRGPGRPAASKEGQ